MPRGQGFARITSINSALDRFLGSFEPINRVETIKLEAADGRILSRDVSAPDDVPHYDRSAMDGYAVRAHDTFGSSKDSGIFLKLTSQGKIREGECMLVHTGSAIPEGADAVVMVENTEPAGESIEVLGQVSPGQNVGYRGEDVKKDDTVFQKGRQLKPSDVGLLASMGFVEIEVYEKPRVMIIPTGEEIVRRGIKPGPGQMNESNGVMNYLYVKRYGGEPKIHDIVVDDKGLLIKALRENAGFDLIVTTGGSSVGKRDLMADVVSSIGKNLVHGVAIKPGKPVLLGYIESHGKRTPVVCLPGYPAACAIDSMVFVDPAVKKLGNMPAAKYRVERAALTRKIASEIGFRTYTRVILENGKATPLRTKGAGILSSISQADGYVIISEDVEGHEAGEIVEVTFLE
jgi:molybdopterin molybdotransferase